MAATRNDVARLAGTSTAVVSYVINGGPRGVADATREKVLRAIEALDYHPNTMARALRARRSRILGLVVPDNSNPYFAEVAREVEEACFEHGYMLFLGNSTQDLGRQGRYIDAFIDTQVDGLLVLPRDHGNPPAPTVRDIPVELIVAIDNELAGYLAAQHLLEHGHRNIGAITGEPGVWPATERVQGFERALHEHGLTPAAVQPARFDTPSAALAARALAHDPTITAIFAPTDAQGFGAIRGANLEGRSVPTSIAVVAVDGTRAAALSAPGLTSVGEPIEQLARRAVARLLARIDDRPEEQRPDLAISLMRRGSCGCPDDAAHDIEALATAR